MTISKFAGGLLMAAPFIGLAIWIVREDGWKTMLGIYGFMLAVLGIIGFGIWLWNVG